MIKLETVYRENGVIVHIGEWNHTEEVDGKQVSVPHDANWVESTEEVETMADGSRIAVSDYVRRRKYPPIGDQLDALFWAMDRGDILKVDEFYDPIKAVKDAHPKP